MSQSELIAELYSLLYTLNSVEKLFIKGVFKSEVQKEEYRQTVDEFLLQWSLIIKSLNIDTDSDPDTDNSFTQVAKLFIDNNINDDFNNIFNFAINRLKSGINGFQELSNLQSIKSKTGNEKTQDEENTSTKEIQEYPPHNGSNIDKKAIAEATSSFITLMDAIKLNYDSKDTLHPLLSDVMLKANKISSDFKGRSLLVSWLIKLNKLDIMDTLDDAGLKQLLWDVDTAYTGFFDQL